MGKYFNFNKQANILNAAMDLADFAPEGMNILKHTIGSSAAKGSEFAAKLLTSNQKYLNSSVGKFTSSLIEQTPFNAGGGLLRAAATGVETGGTAAIHAMNPVKTAIQTGTRRIGNFFGRVPNIMGK